MCNSTTSTSQYPPTTHRHCERSEALILLGAKLNAAYAIRRVNYMDVICNLGKIAASSRLLAMTNEPDRVKDTRPLSTLLPAQSYYEETKKQTNPSSARCSSWLTPGGRLSHMQYHTDAVDKVCKARKRRVDVSAVIDLNLSTCTQCSDRKRHGDTMITM